MAACLIYFLRQPFHLFPKERLIKILEQKAEEEGHFTVYAAMYCYIALDPHPALTMTSRSISREYRSITDKKKDRTHLDDEERKFLAATISETKLYNGMLAGWLALQKHKLDEPSRSWLLGRLSAQIAKSIGSDKEYWQFIQRVVMFKSPAAKKRAR